VILNTAPIIPFTVSLGQSDYPGLDRVMDKLGAVAGRVIKLDAAKAAVEAGSPLATNVVMLGALFGVELLPVKTSTIKETIEARFSPRLAPINLRAFDLGYEAAGKQ